MSKPRLTVELVPETAWASNLRTTLSRSAWDRLRKKTYYTAESRCEICGGRGPKHPVECHETWERKMPKGGGPGTQRLVALTALCPDCHEVKHFGRAQATGHEDRALYHLMKINGWDKAQAKRYLGQMFSLWAKRSKVRWRLDLGSLYDFDIALGDLKAPYG